MYLESCSNVLLFKPRPYLLKGAVQHYAWGTKNDKAFIPQLIGYKPLMDKSYAELWMGTHSKAPAAVFVDDQWIPLDQLINKFPYEILGKTVCNIFNKKLPFLFKILSVGEPLSIQAHPNKQQAIELHSKDPLNYPDDNHKPEIAIALDELTALAGFKSYNQLLETLKDYPEIRTFIGSEIVYKLKTASDISEKGLKPLIKEMYSSLMIKSQSHDTELMEAIDELHGRIMKKNRPLTDAEDLFLTLLKTYPGSDPGLFVLFLLNLVHLKAGQGLFLKAGVPHAYIKGNIVECMANSDNVVRAGLTPKFQDIDTLIEILTYKTTPLKIINGIRKHKEMTYPANVAEFSVSCIDIKKSHKLKQVCKAVQILLVTKGEIKLSCNQQEHAYKKGHSILIPAVLEKYKIMAEQDASIFKVTVPSN